jgi:hypothetical protein
MGVAAADSLLDPRECAVIREDLNPPRTKRPPVQAAGRTAVTSARAKKPSPPPEVARKTAVTSARADKPSPLAVWQGLYKSYKRGETVSGWVTKSVKGGLLVDIGIQAFLPGSEAGVSNASHLDDLVGTKVTVRIVEWGNQQSTSVILSRRVVVEEELRLRAEELLRTLKPGQVRRATVASVGVDGISVDLGGVVAFIGGDEIPGNFGGPGACSRGQEVRVTVCDVRASKVVVSLRTPPEPLPAPDFERVMGTMTGAGVHGLGVEAGEMVFRLSPEAPDPLGQLNRAVRAAYANGVVRIHVLVSGETKRLFR